MAHLFSLAAPDHRDRRRSAWAGVRAVATVAAAASRKARIMVRSAGMAALCPVGAAERARAASG